MKLGAGLEIAQITLTFTMILILGVVMAGMGLAYFMDRAIRNQNLIFHAPKPGGWVDALIRIWGFALVEKQPETLVPSSPVLNFPTNEVLAILNKPRRRGRKPTYSIDRWKRVVFKWENRDTLRDTMTLAELLAEEFGTNADGSPKMTEQSYYDWRNKVFAELKSEAEAAGISKKIARGDMSAHNK